MTERCMWGVGEGDKLISCPLQAATEQRKLLDNLLHTPLVALLPDVKTKNIFVRQKQVFESVKYKHFILEEGTVCVLLSILAVKTYKNL